MKKQKTRRRNCLAFLIIPAIPVCLLVILATLATFSPSFAAQGSDGLRAVIGDHAVAHLEGTVFQIEDDLEEWRYAAGWATPSIPWPSITPGALQAEITNTAVAPTPLPASTEGILTPPPISTSTPAPSLSWMPPAVIPLGSLPGEGSWSPYIQGASGQTLAFRTFLQPDPSRPYAVVGVVAFDTNRTRLHFMLGSVEPYSANRPKRTGQMPGDDKVPGILLAMFNGGFKARHGQFGAMADGITALPAREDLGTIAIYDDGGLQLGEWGSDLNASPEQLAWRQNGPLVVHDGQINPRIYDDSPLDWGYTVDDVSPTWRSGIGLGADGTVLYYLCGPDLTMEMLARSMLAAGIQNGMQLDINNYWVHFVAARVQNNSLSLEPLFPAMMSENVDRYLYPYTRDYFYITIAR